PEGGDDVAEDAELEVGAEQPQAADLHAARHDHNDGQPLAEQLVPAAQAAVVVDDADGAQDGGGDGQAEVAQLVVAQRGLQGVGGGEQPGQDGAGGQQHGHAAGDRDRVGVHLAAAVGLVDQAPAQGGGPDERRQQQAQGEGGG